MSESLIERLKGLIRDDRHEGVLSLLEEHPSLREELNRPHFYFGMPPLAAAKSVAMAQTLHRFGADFETVGAWWRSGFGVRKMVVDVGRYLVSQGTPLSIHAAAALGLVEEVAKRLDQDASLVHAPGGDDGHPIHFARDLETAKLLVERGADLNARDSDHLSTPVQWLIGDAPDVARFLLQCGATPDIFVASALGNQELVTSLIQANPECVSYRTGKKPYPSIGDDDLGGTILQWTLAFNSYPHQVALAKGHRSVYQYLYEHSDLTTQFLVSCVTADRENAERIKRDAPDIVDALDDIDKQLLARYCWETNVDIDAVRLMLDVGFPIDHPETSHGYSPLHNAAWGGYGELVELLIQRGASIDLEDPEYSSTPLGFAIHCCVEDGRHPEGEYGRVAKALIDAGCRWDPWTYPTGDEAIDAVMKSNLLGTFEGAAILGDMNAIEQYLSDDPTSEQRVVALIAAAKAGHLAICQRLLDGDASIERVEGVKWTPMHAAVASQSTAVVELMLSHGGDITLVNDRGGNVWHTLACFGGDEAMVKLLIDSGARPLLNQPSNFGYTPLDLAVMFGGLASTVDLLRSVGAERGETASNES